MKNADPIEPLAPAVVRSSTVADAKPAAPKINAPARIEALMILLNLLILDTPPDVRAPSSMSNLSCRTPS